MTIRGHICYSILGRSTEKDERLGVLLYISNDKLEVTFQNKKKKKNLVDNFFFFFDKEISE